MALSDVMTGGRGVQRNLFFAGRPLPRCHPATLRFEDGVKNKAPTDYFGVIGMRNEGIAGNEILRDRAWKMGVSVRL